MEPHLVGIDLGTSSMKVALMTLSGVTVTWAQRPLTMWVASDGTAEQHPEDWWGALVECMAEMHRAAPEEMRSVAAVAASCAAEGVIPVDDAGHLLMPCITGLDTRGGPALRTDQGGRISVAGYRVPRLLTWLHLAGGAPSLNGTDAAGHIAYLRDHRPDIHQRAARYMAASDYLLWRLTGEWVTPWDSAVLTWTTDNRDPQQVRYHPRLLQLAGVTQGQLAPIVQPTQIVGPLLPDVADALGLARSVQVVAGAVDISASAVGASTVALGEVHLYIGTSGWFGAHVERKQASVTSMMASLPSAVPGRYLLTAPQASSGANPSFLREVLFGDSLPPAGSHAWEPVPPGEAALGRLVPVAPQLGRHPSTAVASNVHSRTTMEQVVECAALAAPGSHGLLYLPWLCGERAPISDESLRAGWVGVGFHHSRSDMARAVFEGVAYHARWLSESIPSFTREPLSEVTACGGGAKSDWWCQIYADVLGVPIRQLVNPQHTNARGAAWVAAVGLGLYAYDDISGLAQVRAVYQPQAEVSRVYDDCYRRFRVFAKQAVSAYRATWPLHHHASTAVSSDSPLGHQ